MILDVLLTLWGVLRLSFSARYWTDKSSLKLICWKECKFVRPQSCTREEKCNARAHKLGNLPPETCSCWKANQKAWRNLTAGRLASHPPPPLLLSSVVEGISMARAYSPGSISILLYLYWFPELLWQIPREKKVLENMLSRLLKCIAESVFLSACVCFVTVAVFVCVSVCVCVCIPWVMQYRVSLSVLHLVSWFHQSVVIPPDIRSIKLILKEQK